MVDGRSMPRKRMANGLTIDQNLVLQELSASHNWKEACNKAGVEHSRFRSWIKRDQQFLRAFEELHGGAIEAVKAQLTSSAQRATETFDDALDATKDVTIETKCPACGSDIKIVAEVPDYGVRLKAGEVILKVNRILKDVKEVEGRVTIAALPLHLQLALAAYDAQQPIPPGAEKELRELGFIKETAALPAPIIEEAEWEEIDDGSIGGENETDPTD